MANTREEKMGDCTIRVMSGKAAFRGTVIRQGRAGAIIEDDNEKRLWSRLRNEAGKLHPNYLGMDGAIARFLTFFPGGFRDPLYLEDERSYKDRSSERLTSVLPLESASDVTPSQAAAIRGALVTNVLSPFELARTSAALRGETGAEYVQGAARFTFGDHKGGLAMMAKAIAPHGRFTWPIATYLPNLWKPKEHMFLKPTATQDFAQRIGHPFAFQYSPEITSAVYEALLELVRDTEMQLSALAPQDRVDVQSFIWVVGDYGAKEEAELNARRLLGYVDKGYSQFD